MKNKAFNTNTLIVDFNQFIESIPGYVYWKDLNAMVVGCNNLQAKSLGYHSKEELIGKTDDHLIWQGLPEAERQRQIEHNATIDQNVMTSGIASLCEEVITTTKGSKHYLVSRTPLKNSANSIIGVLSIALPTATLEPSIASQPISPHRSHSPLKILLIEDNMIASETAQTLLESLHHVVEIASNSTEAISLFEPDKYDIIFTDVGLPGLDGYKLTEQLRKIEKAAQTDPVPIIALTAYESANISRKASASGMDAILTKPLSAAEVNKIMTQYTNNQSKTPIASPSSQSTPNNTISNNNHSTKRSIDLEEGAKILGRQDLTMARKMLDALMATLAEVRTDITKALRTHNYETLREVVHKFYGGLCYVGVPRLRQAGKELEHALVKQEDHQVSRLSQRLLDEMSMVEKEYEAFFKD